MLNRHKQKRKRKIGFKRFFHV